jgi:hypothetical protein
MIKQAGIETREEGDVAWLILLGSGKGGNVGPRKGVSRPLKNSTRTLSLAILHPVEIKLFITTCFLGTTAGTCDLQ